MSISALIAALPLSVRKGLPFGLEGGEAESSAQKAVLAVRDSGRMIVAQQFTAGTRRGEIAVREADG